MTVLGRDALSHQQRVALDAINRAGRCNVQWLADRVGTSREGAAATAGSLRRRGYVAFDTWRGVRVYVITNAGRLRAGQERSTA